MVSYRSTFYEGGVFLKYIFFFFFGYFDASLVCSFYLMWVGVFCSFFFFFLILRVLHLCVYCYCLFFLYSLSFYLNIFLVLNSVLSSSNYSVGFINYFCITTWEFTISLLSKILLIQWLMQNYSFISGTPISALQNWDLIKWILTIPMKNNSFSIYVLLLCLMLNDGLTIDMVLWDVQLPDLYLF